MEKFQVLTAIIKSISVDWATVLFGIFKNMIQSTKQSKGYGVQICYMFSDSGLLEDADVNPLKYKVYNATAIKSHATRSAAVANYLKIKSEATGELPPEKAVAKGKGKAAAKSKTTPEKPAAKPKAKGKRKVIFQESDSEEKTPSPKLLKKSRTLKGKAADPSSLPKFISEEAQIPASEEISLTTAAEDIPVERVHSVATEVIQEEPIITLASPISTFSPATGILTSVDPIDEATEQRSPKQAASSKKERPTVPITMLQVTMRPDLPPARPIGHILKSSVTHTRSGLDLPHCYSVAKKDSDGNPIDL